MPKLCHALFLFAGLLAGCANLPQSRTGFLADYDRLQPAPERRAWGVPDQIDLFVASDVAGAYDAVIIEPAEYRPGAGVDHEPSRKSAEDLAQYYTKILTKTLGEEFEITTTPDPRTARVRAAISEVNPQKPWINWIGLVLLLPLDMGGISGELEVVDAQTGERKLAFTSVREGTPFLVLECFTKYGHARWGMKKWAKMTRSILRDG